MGSTVILEPVMSGPTTTRPSTPLRTEERVATAPVETPRVMEPMTRAAEDNNDLPMSAVEANNAERMNALSKQAQAQAEISCSLDDPEGCEMCSG